MPISKRASIELRVAGMFADDAFTDRNPRQVWSVHVKTKCVYAFTSSDASPSGQRTYTNTFLQPEICTWRSQFQVMSSILDMRSHRIGVVQPWTGRNVPSASNNFQLLTEYERPAIGLYCILSNSFIQQISLSVQEQTSSQSREISRP